MKKTVTGTSSDAVNDIGNPKLHEQHKVVLEKEDGEPVARARVTDQLQIDKMLLGGLITDVEHKAGEYILQTLVDAGAFVRGVNMESTGSSSRFKKTNYTHGLIRLRDVINCIEQAVGEDTTQIIVMCMAKDISPPAEDLVMFRTGLQALDRDYISMHG